MAGIVAIVGRPNVGKSTLFNKLIGKRLSIVEDVAGVTRDRIYAQGEWRNIPFTLIDTGGLEPHDSDPMLSHIKNQADMAIDSADVIILVTDVRTGVTQTDQAIAGILKRCDRPVILCVNKADAPGNEPPEFYEFYALGLGDPISVSAVHGHGTGDLLDAVVAHLPDQTPLETEEERIHVALIGRPNAGKSSLMNRVLGEERMIVSDVPGTTRDAVDSLVDNEYGRFVFIDTAGIRRRSRIDDQVEKFSVMRAVAAIERSDVCLILLDATRDIAEQDEKIAGMAHTAGKACIFVVNKWDAYEKETNSMNQITEKIRQRFSYMPYAPVLFISALTGARIGEIYPKINEVYTQYARRIATGPLNDTLGDAIVRVQPPSDRGKRLKIYYITQASVKPPHFVIFVNHAELFHFSYQRYIENRIREDFGFAGTPIHITIRERNSRYQK